MPTPTRADTMMGSNSASRWLPSASSSRSDPWGILCRVQHHSRRHHRPRPRPAACFINTTGHEALGDGMADSKEKSGADMQALMHKAHSTSGKGVKTAPSARPPAAAFQTAPSSASPASHSARASGRPVGTAARSSRPRGRSRSCVRRTCAEVSAPPRTSFTCAMTRA